MKEAIGRNICFRIFCCYFIACVRELFLLRFWKYIKLQSRFHLKRKFFLCFTYIKEIKAIRRQFSYFLLNYLFKHQMWCKNCSAVKSFWFRYHFPYFHVSSQQCNSLLRTVETNTNKGLFLFCFYKNNVKCLVRKQAFGQTRN